MTAPQPWEHWSWQECTACHRNCSSWSWDGAPALSECCKAPTILHRDPKPVIYRGQRVPSDSGQTLYEYVIVLGGFALIVALTALLVWTWL